MALPIKNLSVRKRKSGEGSWGTEYVIDTLAHATFAANSLERFLYHIRVD